MVKRRASTLHPPREDASAQSAAQDRLRRLAVDSAQIGSWYWDVRTNEVEISEWVEPIFGLEHGAFERTYEAFIALIHPSERESAAHAIAESLCGATDRYELEHRVVWPDGSLHWIEAKGFVYRDAAGTPLRLAGTVADITRRKESEARLVANEMLLRQLIAHAPAAIAMFDREMRYLQVSERWLSDYHLAGRELIGRSHYEVFPDAPARWRDVHQRVLEGAVEACEEDPFPRADGRIEWLQWEVRPWRLADGEVGGLIMLTQVITGRKRAEEALRLAEDKFSLVFRAAPVAILISRIADGLLMDVNREFERLMGYSREEAIGRTTVSLGMWPDPAVRARLAAKPMPTDGSPTVAEATLRAKDGTLIPLSNSAYKLELGGELYMLSAFLDLRERKRAEAAIRASEARLRRVFASPILGFAFADSDGLLTEANEECLRIIGYSPDELARGQVTLRSLTTSDVQTSTRATELIELAETGTSPPREVELVRKDGRRVPVLLGLSAIDDERRHEVIFLFDLSTRRELERQLQHAQRMEAVGRLAAGIAHDFNNVLAAITMSSDLLRDTLSPGHPGREDLFEIRKAAERAIRLIRQLLAFSRQQVLDPRVLDLNELVLHLEHMLQRLVGEQVQVITQFAPGLGAIRADPSQLEQVIVNLTVNARDAMPLGGVLTIQTTEVDFEPQHVADQEGMAAGRYVVLSVTDSGTGMDAQTRARIFEPFFTTKEPGKGTGLGLSTVYGIVRQSGGAIDVTSELGQGTSFRIYLPRVEAPIQSMRPTGVPESAGGSETVLVVEDDAAVRQITRKLLVALGYRVLDAASPAAALELARVYVGSIDLLLSDLSMPGSSGRALAEALLEQRPKLRVVFMSGCTDDEMLRHGGLEADIAFIQKPFSSAALAHKLRLALDAEG